MVDVVDSIIADLEVRLGNYVTNFNKAADAHERFTKTRPDKAAQFSTAEIERYSNRHQQASVSVAKVEEQTTQRVTTTRRKRASDTAAIEQREVASTKAAAKAKADAEIREAERSARLRAVAERAAGRSGVTPAAGGGRIGATVPRESTGQRSISAAALAGTSTDAAAAAEVNHLLADQADLQARLAILSGQDKAQIRDKVQELRYVKQLQAAGLDDAAIALRLDERALLVARERAAVNSKQQKASVGNFAKGAGFGRVGGGAAAIGGIAVAAGAYAGYSAVESAVDDAKVLKAQSDQLGLNTRDLQVYQVAAERANVSQEQFRSSIAQLTGALGKAQEGGEEQAKVFRALNIDIGNSRDGFKTTSQILPELINRLSGISDPARRAAVETALLGEEGRRLDSLLSGGIDSINQLGDAMERAGSILTPAELDQLTQAGKVLDDVKRQLSVDLSRIVAGNSDAIQALAHTFEFLADRIGGAIQKYSAYLKITSGAATPLESAAAFAVGAVMGTSPGVQAESMTADARASLEKIRPTGRQANQRALDTLFAPKPPKGPKGKSADQLANEADDRTRRFNDIMGRLYDEQQRAVSEQTQNEYERSDLERRQIERDRDREVDDLKLRAQQDIRKGADAKLTNARLAQATAATEAAAGEKIQVINLRDTIEGLNRTSAARQRSYDLQATMLSDMEGLARTQSERRRIAEQQRDIDRQRETDSANLVIARAEQGDPSVSTIDLQGARETLRTQNQRFASRAAVENKQTAGPLEQYRDEIPRTADQINEALENVKVDGLRSLDDAITNSISGVFKLGGAFGSVANTIISDLIRIGVQRAIIGPLADSLFGKAGGGGGGGIGKLIGGIGSLFSHHAGGGNVVGGVPIEVGENGRELFVPSQSGKIVPNNARVATASGGTTLHQTFNIDASGVNPEGYAESIVAHVERRTAAAIRASSAATLDAAPARVNRVSVLGG